MSNRPKPSPARGPTQRQLRVGELFRQRLCEVLARGDVRDAAIDTRMVTVTQIRVSPDLRNATAYVVPLGTQNNTPKKRKNMSREEDVLKELNRLAATLRGQMSKGLRLKYVPVLKFKIDNSFDNATAMDELLDRADVRRDLDERPDDGEL